jgi:hypothetical protein
MNATRTPSDGLLGEIRNRPIIPGRNSWEKWPSLRHLGQYKQFLDLWKDADPGVSIFKTAKAEYAKLL